jgi:NhaP-type Na+/H+ or K+/H+ antiporter
MIAAPKVQITLLLTTSFTVFYVSETVLEVSGVLAVVSLGLWMSMRGKYVINPEVKETAENVLVEIGSVNCSHLHSLSPL